MCHPAAWGQLRGGGDRGVFGGTVVGAKPGGTEPQGFYSPGGPIQCHPLPGAFRRDIQSPLSKPTHVVGAPRVPGELDLANSHPGGRGSIPVEEGQILLGWCPQDAHAQHWLHSGAPPTRRASWDSMVPVGVGGVTMMEGTCRCFSPGDAACVLSLQFPLLTHIFKPFKQDNSSPMFSSSQRDPALQPHRWPLQLVQFGVRIPHPALVGPIGIPQVLMSREE